MKILLDRNIKPLMSKHIFNELTKRTNGNRLAFKLLDIDNIENNLRKIYLIGIFMVKIKMTHKNSTVFVECQENSNISMGRSIQSEKRHVRLIHSLGGTAFRIANASIKSFRS